MVLTDEVRAEISSAVRGFDGSSSFASLSLPKSCDVERRDCCCWMRIDWGVVGAMKAVAVEARMARRASFMVAMGYYNNNMESRSRQYDMIRFWKILDMYSSTEVHHVTP